MILLLANLFTLLALFGDRWWFFELMTHFPVQLAAAQVAGLLYFGVRRQLRPVLVTLPILLINAAAVGPYYLPTRAEAAGSLGGESDTLRVMTLNLRAGNDRVDLVERAIAEEDPDVILFVEATHRWYRHLTGVRSRYPHEIHRIVPRRDAILLVSRLPLRTARVLEVGAAGHPVLSASVCPRDGSSGDGGVHCLAILGTHAPRPQDAYTSAARNDQLLSTAAVAAEHRDGRIIMLGDFNLTPYSPVFPEVLSVGRLRDSALGFAPWTTWLSRFPLFGLPIDHVLVGRGVTVLDRRVGAAIGSDHLPVIADLAF